MDRNGKNPRDTHGRIDSMELIQKADMAIMLAENRKAIQLKEEIKSQNEHMLENQSNAFKWFTSFDDRLKKQDEKIEKLIKQSEETNRDLFKIQILFLTGVISIIIQVINIFLKK